MQHVLLRKWGGGLCAGHLPNSLMSLLKVNGYNHVPLYVGTWGPFGGSAPIWCVQVMLYEKELSYGVLVVQHTFYAAPQKYVQKIEDLQAWEGVQEQKIQVLQDLSFARKGIIQSLRG
jgi:hypothetical protein